jgi:hypothetical protein
MDSWQLLYNLLMCSWQLQPLHSFSLEYRCTIGNYILSSTSCLYMNALIVITTYPYLWASCTQVVEVNNSQQRDLIVVLVSTTVEEIWTCC